MIRVGIFLLVSLGVCAQANIRDRIRSRIEKRLEKKTESKSSDRYQSFRLDFGGRERLTRVYLPKNYSETGKYPLVINLHGGMGWAEQQADLSKMNAVADEFGFIVAYPNGTGKMKGRILTFNAGVCCGYARDEKVDDVGFIRTLIEQLPKKHSIDSKRVYLTGFSNGAMLSHRIAMELSPLIAGIAPVSGGKGTEGTPAGPVPVIHFHGLKDENARFEGGKGSNQFDPAPHPPISETIAFWVKANHCEPTPKVTKGKSFIMERYDPRAGEVGAPVVLVKFPEGGHTWPGGGEISEKLNVGPQVKDYSASREMWAFLRESHR